MSVLTHAFDLVAIAICRFLAIVALGLGAIYAAAFVLDKLLQRAAYLAIMLKFAHSEYKKSPRSFWNRMLWGKKEDA